MFFDKKSKQIRKKLIVLAKILSKIIDKTQKVLYIKIKTGGDA